MIIKMIGANYSPFQSSSGKIPTKNFKWSTETGEAVVYFDNSIQKLLQNKELIYPKHKTFGWISESPALTMGTIEHLKANYKEYEIYFNTIYTYSDDLLQLDAKLFDFCYAGSNLPWTPITQYGIYKKNKLVSILCSNNTTSEGHINRVNIAKTFIGKIDCYGDLFGKRIGGSGHYHHNSKEEALKDYMFSITIENCVHNTYFTEKITDCFANGVVPVYLGTRNVTNFFDADGIIFLDDSFQLESLTEELYVSKIKAIENNLQIVKNMTNADDYLFNNIINRLPKKDI
jgi:hypothetical protein